MGTSDNGSEVLFTSRNEMRSILTEWLKWLKRILHQAADTPQPGLDCYVSLLFKEHGWGIRDIGYSGLEMKGGE